MEAFSARTKQNNKTKTYISLRKASRDILLQQIAESYLLAE